MKLTDALKFLKTTLENVAIASVRSLSSNIFKVKLTDKQIKVSFPKIQKVEGKVAVTNAKDYDPTIKQSIKELASRLDKLNAYLPKLVPYKRIKVTNLKDYPSSIRVENLRDEVKVTNMPSLDLSVVSRGLDEVKQAIDKLPTKYPEVRFPDIRFPNIPQPLKRLSIDNLETLKGTDPTSYVPVRLTDGEDFYEAIGGAVARSPSAFADELGRRSTGLVDEDRHVQVDVVSLPYTPNLNDFAINHIDEASDNLTYLGKEDIDGAWMIQRMTTSGTITATTFATINNNPDVSSYSEAWDARTTLTYGTYAEAF